jgi:Zn-dependent alcohol dehydrogenase
MGCKLAGCHPIVAVDVLESKLDFARRVGATIRVPATQEDAVERTRQVTGGGAEYVFDSVGSAITIPQALAMAQPGGTAVVMGLHAVRSQVPISAADLILANRRLLGSFVGSMTPDLDLPRMIDLYQAGRLPLDDLISQRYSLNELPQAFADMEAGSVARGVLIFE